MIGVQAVSTLESGKGVSVKGGLELVSRPSTAHTYCRLVQTDPLRSSPPSRPEMLACTPGAMISTLAWLDVKETWFICQESIKDSTRLKPIEIQSASQCMIHPGQSHSESYWSTQSALSIHSLGSIGKAFSDAF